MEDDISNVNMISSEELADWVPPFQIQTIPALVQHGLKLLKLDTTNKFNDISKENQEKFYNWITKFNFKIDKWNEAKENMLGYFTDEENLPVQKTKRKDLKLAFLDVLKISLSKSKIVDFRKFLWLINPLDLQEIPCLSGELFNYSNFQIGLEMANMNKEPTKPKREKPTYAQKAKASAPAKVTATKTKPKSIIGTRKPANAKPVVTALYLSLPKEVKLDEILNILKQQHATDITTVKLVSGNNYQIKFKIIATLRNFFNKSSIWPDGTRVQRWRGPLDLKPKTSFTKRMELRRVPDQITSEMVKKFAKTHVFTNVILKQFDVTDLSKGKMILTVQVDDTNYGRLMSNGLKKALWPGNSRIRWLKKSSVKMKALEWDS